MLSPADILGSNGRIASRLQARYEERREQLQMAEAVAQAIRSGRHLVVEAGTGVGKSFAYLVPAILAAVGEAGSQPVGGGKARQKASTHADAESTVRDEEKPTGPRIVVSTHTITLQEQLIQKDLPLLQSVIPQEFSAVLVKGRGNYLSLRRMQNALARSAGLFHEPEEFDQLRELAQWSKASGDGSLADLKFRPASTVWDEVVSDHSNCMGRGCPSHKDCFYYRARRRAENAQVLVVNHALFFSDLALRRQGASILPDYDIVILDEAHTVESVAGDHLGLSLSSSQIDFQLNRLFNDRYNRGLLVFHKLKDAQQQVLRCHELADDFFTSIDEWIAVHAASNGRVPDAEIVPNQLSPALLHLARMVRKAGAALNDEKQKHDFTSAHDRLTALAGEIEAWRKQALEGAVYWVERSQSRRGQRRIELAAAPINVSPILRESCSTRRRPSFSPAPRSQSAAALRSIFSNRASG